MPYTEDNFVFAPDADILDAQSGAQDFSGSSSSFLISELDVHHFAFILKNRELSYGAQRPFLHAAVLPKFAPPSLHLFLSRSG